ncbi:aldo/keto reductase [Magnetococcus marinus MC-1]|uniref:Aldo/keto reductase n=1 Tax=Magnetococcus marinus (strain ATCC BAA-1437 / JCM 17883 / MC-1) TaxID=156889 RepID=A0L9G8_MAGMM|nr:aldo/keto reductase [Magnetococcus marinus]ABK44611.1 aldo/keto reductase [Magnetococcus marinus MC-1]
MERRTFIKGTLTTAGAAVASTLWAESAQAEPKQPRIEQYRKLGKTDINMSDISFGAGRLSSASLVLRAIQRGINYIDTAPDYGPSEAAIGEALSKYKQRDKLVIASKFCQPGYHLPLGSKKADYIAAVEGSLRRMGCDYLDVVFTHALGSDKSLEQESQRLHDGEMLAAYAELKQQGKVRYLATSSHGPYNMETLLLEAVNGGYYDIIMPAFNFMKFPRLEQVIQAAQQKGVGVIAMKTLAGAKDSLGERQEGSFEQAAFKWVLKHPQVAGLVISFRKTSELDLFLGASGQAFAMADQKVLDRYAALYGNHYCRTGCSDCERSCEVGVPVGEILRQRMYFEDYGDEKLAMQLYSRLSTNAQACVGCDQAACAGQCRYGVPIQAALVGAHRMLTLES